MGAQAQVKYHYSYSFFTYSMVRRASRKAHILELRVRTSGPDPCRRHCQVGSLAGAAHLSNDNAGVLR